MRKRRLSPRKTPRQERSRATVEALLEATADILIREGYAKLTTNRIAERAGVNIASLYQYFPGKDAIVAELRRRHGADQRAALRRVLAEHEAGELESTIRTLVSIGVSGHAHAPRLHRVFTEELPALGYRDVAAIDAPIFEAMRRFLRAANVDVRDMDLALWMISTASSAVLHRAAVERPEDLSTGVIAEELVTLLCRYLRRPTGPRRRRSRGRASRSNFSGVLVSL
ncbi:MAG TPA: TetR/AcrR family transcriptional regulator [Vicinamibacterales bacterium]